MWKKFEKWVEGNEWWILAAIGAVILRIPSLFEPYWYGDEGIYLTIGRALNMGVKLYPQIHDNKPPFLYLAAALAGGEQFWFRLEAMVINIATVIIFSFLAKKIFIKEKMAKQIAIWVLVLVTNLPFWEGNIANAELFFLLPTITSVYLLWGKSSLKQIFIAGVCLGIAGLFKVPAVLEAGIWPLIWFRSGQGWWKKTGVLGVGVVIPIAASFVYYYLQGSGGDYFTAAWAQNIPYLSSWKPSSVETGIYLLKNRIIISVVYIAVLLGLAKKTGTRGTVVGVWGVVTLFSALLSGRPYPHYLLQMAGVIAVLGGILAQGNHKEKMVGGSVLVMLLVAWVSFKFYVYPTASYYMNFTSWVWGKESKQEYFSKFNREIKNLYETARIIKTGSKAQDKIFVWGDVPMLYALAERLPASKYMVKYHIQDFRGEKLTMEQIKQVQPKYIVVSEKNSQMPGLGEYINNFYLLESKVGDFEIYKLSRVLPKWVSS